MSDATTTGWRGHVTVALIAAMAPLTVAVYGGITRSRELSLAQLAREKELALATQEQDFKMRMEFLDRAIDVKRTPEDRQLVLRFLRAVSTDQPLSQWAEAELGAVQEDVDTFRAAREQLAKALDQARSLETEVRGQSLRSAAASTSGAAEREVERRTAALAVEQATARVHQLLMLRALESSGDLTELASPSADSAVKTK